MKAKEWLRKLFLYIIIIGLLPYIGIFILLQSNFEHNKFEDIVKRQLLNKSIYGTALNQNTFKYKLELIKQTKPEIVVLGSSRMMQFREQSFSSSFINAGGAMNHLSEGYQFIQEMYQVHTPKYIILGLDFWWFNANFIQPNFFSYHKNDGTIFDYKKIISPIKWLYTGKIDYSIINNIWHNGIIKNKYTNYDNLGFSAISTSDGFRHDGSRLYNKTIFGLDKSNDVQFKDTLSRIKNGNKRFQYATNLDNSRLVLFNKIIKYIDEKKTTLILIVPPVANIVHKEMKNYNYFFINKLEKYLKKLNIELYFHHNISKISSDDCEFIDGFHGGDILYQRILENLYINNSIMKDKININHINKNINNYRGHVLTIENNSMFNKLQEIDFLNLSCKKNRVFK